MYFKRLIQIPKLPDVRAKPECCQFIFHPIPPFCSARQFFYKDGDELLNYDQTGFVLATTRNTFLVFILSDFDGVDSLVLMLNLCPAPSVSA